METATNHPANSSNSRSSSNSVKRERERSTDCYVCNESFATADEMNAHMQKHSNANPYLCEICDQTFPNKEYLALHKKFHVGEGIADSHEISENPRKKRRKFKCDQCDVKVNSQYHLDIHRSKHEGEEAKTHICEICSKSFIAAQFLKTHLLTHSAVATFNCMICGANFTGAAYLKLHMQIHTQAKKYKCTKCEEWFATKQCLVTHSKKHTKMKNFNCDVCLKSFVSRVTMQKHRSTHEENPGNGMVRCDLCARAVRASLLRTHKERSHRDHEQQRSDVKRPYKCNVCGRCFIMELNLNLHIRIVHPEYAEDHENRSTSSDDE